LHIGKNGPQNTKKDLTREIKKYKEVWKNCAARLDGQSQPGVEVKTKKKRTEKNTARSLDNGGNKNEKVSWGRNQKRKRTP